MSFWFLIQSLVNLILLAGVVGLWIRLNRPPKDDPRLSKGLQLLQSKIAVLEDLSDRTEIQVGQLSALLEQKCKDIQAKIQSAEKQVAKIEQSMQKSLEVAKIFQDRIPHTEILERQNTIKYVKAARLAHQGLSVDEIAQQISDLSRGEIEFIAQVNRDQLMFCEESLPEWAHQGSETNDLAAGVQDDFVPLQREKSVDMSKAFEIPQSDQEALKKLGEAFKAACDEAEIKNSQSPQKMPEFVELLSSTVKAAATGVTASIQKTTQELQAATAGREKNVGIRPVEFRRIDMTKDLG